MREDSFLWVTTAVVASSMSISKSVFSNDDDEDSSRSLANVIIECVYFCQCELVSLTLAFSVREAGGERFRVSLEFA